MPLHIPFEPAMLAELHKIIAHNRALDRAAKPPRLMTHVLVNAESGGAPWLYRHFNRTWNTIKDHAIARTGRTQMDELHWHDLRRSRCVELKRQGFAHDRRHPHRPRTRLDRRDDESLRPGRSQHDRRPDRR